MPTNDLSRDDDLYRRLQQHLDRMPVPFPATRSGIELRLLRHLFTPDDVRVALCLSAIPERAAAIQRRLARRARAAAGASGPASPAVSREAVVAALDSMVDRGLINRLGSGPGALYGKMPLAIGFYEAQVNRLTPELQRDLQQYADEAFGAALHSTPTPQLRAVPVPGALPPMPAAPGETPARAKTTTTVSLDAAIPFERAVGRYDDIRALVRASKGPFAVMNCICQQGKDLVGEPCRQTDGREHCLTLGPAARATVARGDARAITRDEMIALLDQADRDGLVVEPQNTQDPLFICCCCGCCCGVLTTAKKLPRPADFFAANYTAEVDADACIACAVCGSRCQMDAIAYDAGPAAIAEERCIGCGLCITTCASGAIRLVPRADARVPPKDTGRLYARMYRERFGAAGLAAAVGRRLIGLES
jgi:NAD-dependent dihydropyrimidine dehydrogenase PreA subunit